jgi:hypothetical protein
MLYLRGTDPHPTSRVIGLYEPAKDPFGLIGLGRRARWPIGPGPQDPFGLIGPGPHHPFGPIGPESHGS